jgi:hypothetical protein
MLQHHEGPLLPDEEARRQLGGISRSTLWRLRRNGQIKFYRVGDRVLYSQKHIAEYLDGVERQLNETKETR